MSGRPAGAHRLTVSRVRNGAETGTSVRECDVSRLFSSSLLVPILFFRDCLSVSHSKRRRGLGVDRREADGEGLEERHGILNVHVELVAAALSEQHGIVLRVLLRHQQEVLDAGLRGTLLEVQHEALALAVPLRLLVLRKVDVILRCNVCCALCLVNVLCEQVRKRRGVG